MSLGEDDFGFAGVGKCGAGGFVEGIGDDGVDLADVEHLGEGAAANLIGVDEQENGLGQLSDRPLGIAVEGGVLESANLRHQAGAGKEGLVDVIGIGLQAGIEADVGEGFVVEDSAETYQADVGGFAQLQGDEDGIGHDGNVVGGLGDGAGEAGDGAGTIEKDAVAGMDELQGLGGDLLLGFDVDVHAAGQVGLVELGGGLDALGAALDFDEQPGMGQIVDVAADGEGRDVEHGGEVFVGDNAGFLDVFDDFLLSFSHFYVNYRLYLQTFQKNMQHC